MNSFDLDHDYEQAQHSIIANLTKQIQNLLPLHYSYSDLRTYRDKIFHSLEVMAQQNYVSTQMQLEQIKETIAISQELDQRKTELLEKIDDLQRQKSKLTLQRKNYLNLCEAQTNRYALENKQNKIIKQRTIELLTNAEAIQKSIDKLKQTLNRLEQTASIKEHEIKQNQNDIQQLRQKNKTLLQKKQELQKKMKQTAQQSQKIVENNKNIIINREQAQKNIENVMHQNKMLKQRIISAKKQIQDKKNQQQYYAQRLNIQENNIKILQEKQEALSIQVENRRKQLAQRITQNNSLMLQIQQEKQKTQNQHEKNQLSNKLLRQILQTNRILLVALENSCKQDRRIYDCLNKKFDRLQSLRQNVQKSEQIAYKKGPANHSKTISIVDKFYSKQNSQSNLSFSKLKQQNYKQFQQFRNPLKELN